MRKWSFVVFVVILLGVIFSALTMLPDNARATVLYVGGVGIGNYTTIQEAIDDSNSGDTVYVFNGTYSERIWVSRQITLIGEDKNTTLIDGGESGTVVRITPDWVNITGFTVRNGGTTSGTAGIELAGANDCSILGNDITGNWQGVYVHGPSEHNIIANNSVSANVNHGIHVLSDNNRLQGNVISASKWGIYLRNSDGNLVANNSISSNSESGISLSFSSNTTLTANSMSEDGLYVGGTSSWHWITHTIGAQNTVNGKPVRYWKNTLGGAIPSDAGQVILANCTGVTVEGQNVSNGSVGIQLGFSSGNSITGNTASRNDVSGIRLYVSDNNTVEGNNVSSNEDSIVLTLSYNNNIVGNFVSSSIEDGVRLSNSHNNTVSNNTVSENYRGIEVLLSNDNRVYHNNFVGNNYQALDNSANEWDDGYPSGGNYWSDYSGIDNCSGPNQSVCPDPDGIGDTNHSFGDNGLDKYPFMEPLPLGIPLPPENQHPECEISHPEDHARIHGSHLITGTASDEDGTIESVEIRIDDDPWIEVNGTTSWSYEWHTEDIENGEYTIYARSFDGTNYSAVVNVTVDVHNPTEEEMMYGEIFFWTAIVLVVIIALVGLGLEVRRRKKEES
ncbi:MAG: right-handed parallel beta-helix repeat-containing protein [Thermoplasmata archaeon]|nr:right-handed parallel beta-helix repeat-containing protein [Thermoplasmata archaeon]